MLDQVLSEWHGLLRCENEFWFGIKFQMLKTLVLITDEVYVFYIKKATYFSGAPLRLIDKKPRAHSKSMFSQIL